MVWVTRPALALLLLLGGCIAHRLPAGLPTREPALEEQAIRTADDQSLPLRDWQPAGSAWAVILALHGMNDYANAFDSPGRALATHGIATYAYDQRGFGRGPHPGFWSDQKTLAADARTALRLLAARHPGLPLFLLGESMGGAVAIEALTGEPPPPEVTGAILVAPALWGRDTMGLGQRSLLWLAEALVPGLTLSGRGLEIQPSDNIEMLRALSRDPLVIKETRVDAIHGLVDLMDAAEADIARLPVPCLLLYGAKDQVIPPEPIKRGIAALPRPDQRAALYPEGWHMLLRDLQAQRVIKDIAAWIATPAVPLPSGAEQRSADETR